GLNPDFQDALTTAGLRLTATDDDGEVRAVEIPGHPFFLATLFLPQYISTPEQSHPLITAYLEAALHVRRARDPATR
ncbi:MAG: CTP synthase C-terminal region-related (seleno)protein, partial [Dehalococcoidia bacterium]